VAIQIIEQHIFVELYHLEYPCIRSRRITKGWKGTYYLDL